MEPKYAYAFVRNARGIVAEHIQTKDHVTEYVALGIEIEKLDQLAGIHDALIRLDTTIQNLFGLPLGRETLPPGSPIRRQPGTDSSSTDTRACSTPNQEPLK